MKLTRVTGKPFRVTCIKCGRKTETDFEQIWADIEGTPFKAYYCQDCSNKLSQYKDPHFLEWTKIKGGEGNVAN